MASLAGVILIFITAAVCYTIGMRYLFTKTTIHQLKRRNSLRSPMTKAGRISWPNVLRMARN
jgi:hypothetical protein